MDFVNGILDYWTNPLRVILGFLFYIIIISIFSFITIYFTKGIVSKIALFLMIVLLISFFLPIATYFGKPTSIVELITKGHLNFAVMALSYLMPFPLILFWQSKKNILIGIGLYTLGFISYFFRPDWDSPTGDWEWLHTMLPPIIILILISLYLTHYPVKKRINSMKDHL